MADEKMVPLRKELAGTAAASDGTLYAWAKDGSVVDVPQDFALELLKIPDGGFCVADGNDAPAKVTAAAPGAAAKTQESPPKGRDASPITPKPRGGTIKR